MHPRGLVSAALRALAFAATSALVALAPRASLAQPGPPEPPVSEQLVVRAAQTYAHGLAPLTELRDFDEVRRTIAAYDALADLRSRAMSANDRYTPAALAALRSRLRVGPDELDSLFVPLADRCRLLRVRDHVYGVEMMRCAQHARVPDAVEGRAMAERLGSMPPRASVATAEQTYGNWRQLLASHRASEQGGDAETLALVRRSLVYRALDAADVPEARRWAALLDRGVASEIARADVEYVAGDRESALRRVRAQTDRDPSNVETHVARMTLAVNLAYADGEHVDPALAREAFDHARVVLCLVDPQHGPTEFGDRALGVVGSVLARVDPTNTWRVRGPWSEPGVVAVLPANELPVWFGVPPMGPQTRVLDTCESLLQRVAPNARTRRARP